jgi:hypothetical protein
MIHPFQGDLDQLKDNEIEETIADLTKKYYAAARLGKPELLTQISTFITIYKEELSKRLSRKLRADDENDLGQLINVDR